MSFDHPRFARRYTELAEHAERRGQADLRRELVSSAHGVVCEVGSGHGLTFTHYPSAVRAVVAVEPESTLRTHAHVASQPAPVPVVVVAGDAERLPLADASVDVVVYSLVLCSVREPAAAFAEARRVLRPGGSVLVYEHVRSQRFVVGALERLVTPWWSRFAAGCHLDRDPLATATAAGFVVEQARRFGFSPGPGLPAVSHVMAQLRRP
ncbi:MAG: class I SAM-dependent methyltransferase [Angustibacter sp.]